MSESPSTPPDRLSIDPRSPFFDESILQRGIGIRFKGRERTNVLEYCMSEGWIRVQAGRSLDRRGNPMTVRLDGPVEAWFEDTATEGGDSAGAEADGEPAPPDEPTTD